MKPNGAYCLACQSEGPNLQLWTPDLELPEGTRGTVAFTCGRCGAHWRWTVTWTAEGPRYSDAHREDH